MKPINKEKPQRAARDIRTIGRLRRSLFDFVIAHECDEHVNLKQYRRAVATLVASGK